MLASKSWHFLSHFQSENRTNGYRCSEMELFPMSLFTAGVILVLFRLQGCGYTSDPRHIILVTLNLNLTLTVTLILTLTLRPYCLETPKRTLPCTQCTKILYGGGPMR